MAKSRIFKTSDELNRAELKAGDIVVLSGAKYRVTDNELADGSYMEHYSYENGLAFLSLNLNAKKLSSICYGYKHNGGRWPEAHTDDYEALRRLCVVLMLFSEGAKAVEVYIGDKWVHIDRADVTTK